MKVIIMTIAMLYVSSIFGPYKKSYHNNRTHSVGWCEAVINPEYKLLEVVVATMYHPVPEQTNEHPNIVADGTMFDISTASDLNWVAVSRDLLSRWGGPLNYGDVVYISAHEKTGMYLVKDTMNKRFTKRIDFLESPGTAIYKYDKALLYLVRSETFSQGELWAINLNNKITLPNERKNIKKTKKVG